MLSVSLFHGCGERGAEIKFSLTSWKCGYNSQTPGNEGALTQLTLSRPQAPLDFVSEGRETDTVDLNNNNNNNNNNEFLNRMALQYMRTVIKGVL